MFYQSKKLIILATLSVFLSIFISGCMATHAVHLTGKVKVYNGLEAVAVWDDGSITLKESEIEISALSKKMLKKYAESYYHITIEDINVLSESVSDKYWLKLNYKPYKISKKTNIEEIDQIEKLLNSSSPNKEENVFSFYNHHFGQIKHPNKDPVFAISIDPSRRQLKSEYRTATGSLMQILMIPAVVIDVVTFPIQYIYATDNFNDAFN